MGEGLKRAFASARATKGPIEHKRMRLTWRKQPHSAGLASIGEGPRGAILKVNGEDVGFVQATRVGWDFAWRGWNWYARGEGVPPRNEASVRIATAEEAKAACEAYVRACLAKPAEVKP